MSRMDPKVRAEWEAAKAAGVKRYESKIPCKHGHVGMRFTLDRKCCECNAISCRARHKRRIGADGLQAWRERESLWAENRKRRSEASANADARRKARQAAIEAGDTIYFTGPCPKGHREGRYTSNGSCVVCAKAQVKERVESGYYREYYQENSEIICERSKKYAASNRERLARASRAWVKRNPEKRIAIARQYRARRRAHEEGGISAGTLANWTAAQPKVCFYCGDTCPDDFHVDHFVPLSKGGPHVLTNLRIACAPCNLSKSARDPMEWMDMIQPVMEVAA